MKEARIHGGENANKIVTADEVLKGTISKKNDFVDIEYDFRVKFVKAAKNHGSPYFRIYYCKEDYEKYSPERKKRYEIIKNMHHEKESKWHKKWKDNVKNFAKIEKTIKNPNIDKYKRADAFIEKYNLCVEFQHSYIAFDFEERNKFYEDLKYKIVWLYDLTMHSTVKENDGCFQIVEDNARGFFRIAEKEENLSEHSIFIQVKDGTIYKISKLYRKEIQNDKNLKSTIRYFYPDVIFNNENEFIEALKKCDNKLFDKMIKPKTIEPDSIYNLWDKEYSKNKCSKIIFKNIENEKMIIVYGDKGNPRKMLINFEHNCVVCKYIDFFDPKTKEYSVSLSLKTDFYGVKDSRKKIWTIVCIDPIKKL